MRSFLILALLGLAYGAPSQQAGLCEVCHLLVGEVQDLVTTGQTQKTITSYVENACSKLPTEEKDTCHSFLRDNSKTIFSQLTKDLSPHDFCLSLEDVCPSQERYAEPEPEPEPEVADPSANPLECELCKLVVLGIDKLIGQNRSEAAINATLEKFCDGLPAKVSDVCHKIEPFLLKAISSGLEPDVACKLVRLCGAVDNEEGSAQLDCGVCHAAMSAIGIEDTGLVCVHPRTCREEIIEEPVRIVEPVQETLVEPVEAADEPELKGTIECQICKFAVQAVDHILGENRTAATINETLMQVCNGLPGELKDSCLNVEPDILNAILGGIDPSKACDFLKICNDATKGFTEISCDACKEAMEAADGELGVSFCYKFEDICGTQQTAVVENVEADAGCELCEFVVQLLDELLASGTTIERVNDTLIQICQSLPDQYKSICLSLVPQIDQIIAAGVDPNTACVAVNLCPKTEEVPVMTDDMKCELCSKLSEALPIELASTIKSGVCTEVCHQRQRRSTLKKLGQMIKNTKVKGFAECELCHIFVRTIDSLVGENKTLAEVNATVYEICNRLTGIQLIDICLQDAPRLVPILKEGVDPIKTCIEIKLCTQEDTMAKKDVTNTVTNVKDTEQPTSGGSPLLKAFNKKIKQSVGDAKCELCQAIVEMADKYIQNNATDQQINETLYQLCSSLPEGELKDLCIQEEPAIMYAIENGLDPKETCQKANLCAETKTAVESPLLKAINKRIRQNVGDLKCELCEAVVEMADKYLQDNETDQKINETINQLCTSLPDGQFKDLCLQEEAAIMAAIGHGFDPKASCEKANLCAETKDLTLSDVTSDTAFLQYLNQKKLRKVGDLKCDVCEAAVKLVDSYIEDNATIEKINETLYQICSSLPDGAFKDICKNEVPAIMEIVESGGFDPEKVCTAAGLCDATIRSRKMKMRKMMKIVPEALPVTVEEDISMADTSEVGNLKDLKCTVCEAVIKEIDNLVDQNETIAKINETIYNVCSQLIGALQNLCLESAPQILQALEAGVDPEEACTKIGLCSSTEDVTVDISPVNVGDIKCDICELIVEGIDRLVKDNATDEKINATIYNVCSQLPGTAQKYCINVAPEIVQAIVGGADPAKACEEIKLCTGQYAVKLDLVENNYGSVECDICELLIDEIDKYIGNASASRINETVYEICGRLPNALQSMCIQMAPTIVKELENGVDPKEACTKLKLCTSQDEEMLNTMENNYGTIECDICELLIDEMDKYIGNASASQINATMYEICGRLPNALQSLCIQMAPTIVKELENGVDPKEACTKLKLCTSQDIEMESEPIISYQVDIKCDVCEFIISELDKILVDNATDAKINASIFAVCGKLTGPALLLCRTLAPGLVKDVENGLPPNKACTLLTFCPDTAVEIEAKVDIKCDVCEFLIREMDKILVDNATEQMINSSIYSVCGKLSGTALLICHNLAPGLVQSIEAGLNPNTACLLLTLCPNQDELEAENTEITSEYTVQTSECGQCRRSLQAAYDEVDEMKLQRMLLSICERMPLAYKQKCENLVNVYGGKYVKMVLQHYTPTNLCELAHCFENGEPTNNGSS